MNQSLHLPVVSAPGVEGAGSAACCQVYSASEGFTSVSILEVSTNWTFAWIHHEKQRE